MPATAWTLPQGLKHAALDSFCLMPACEDCRGQAWNLVVRGATTDMELSDVRTNTSILGNPSAICPVTAFKKPQFNAGGKTADEGGGSVRRLLSVALLQTTTLPTLPNEVHDLTHLVTFSAGLSYATIEMLGGIPRTKAETNA